MSIRIFFAAGLTTACFFILAPLQADEFHNIRGLVGERPSGMGGAYAAISDDPAGAYYNPAGLAFAQDNYLSVSATNFRDTETRYNAALGPGQDYTRESRDYIPNFLGAVRRLGEKSVLAFSLVMPTRESADQSDYGPLPFHFPEARLLRVDYSVETAFVLAGPSLAFSFLDDKLSVGVTLYYFFDTRRARTSAYMETKNNTVNSLYMQERSGASGLFPVLGFQFMPGRWSFGLSVRRPYTLHASSRVDRILESQDANVDTVFSGSEHAASTIRFNTPGTAISAVAAPPAASGIPEPLEGRAGVAYFFSNTTIFSMDAIYTSGYMRERSSIAVDALRRRLVVGLPDYPELERVPTFNLAAGVEFFLTDRFAVRAGLFTNKSNRPDVNWFYGAAATALLRTQPGSFTGFQIAPEVDFDPTVFTSNYRVEHADLIGYSLAFTWGDASASLTVSFVREAGRGGSQVAPDAPPQTMRYVSNTLYIGASTVQ